MGTSGIKEHISGSDLLHYLLDSACISCHASVQVAYAGGEGHEPTARRITVLHETGCPDAVEG
jgi:hypothetical protein